MATAQDKAQELCSKTEWDTVVNSFPPRVEELSAAVLKKHANRVRRFLDKEKAAPEGEGRLACFEEALQRLEQAREKAATSAPEGAEQASETASETDKLAARREKEKAAREREKAVRERRKEVKTKLKEKADKEKAEKEGPPSEDGKEKKGGVGVRGHLQAAAKRSQGKIGSRKV